MIQCPSSSLGMRALEFSHQAVRKHKESYEIAPCRCSGQAPIRRSQTKATIKHWTCEKQTLDDSSLQLWIHLAGEVSDIEQKHADFNGPFPNPQASESTSIRKEWSLCTMKFRMVFYSVIHKQNRGFEIQPCRESMKRNTI